MTTDSNDLPDFRMAETRWTQVIQSKGESSEAKMALKDLTAAYYAPVFQFIQDRTRDREATRDLTQEFFSRVLDRYGFEGADPQRGRFRSFLLGAVKHFLSEQSARAGRQKRGGEVMHQSIDEPLSVDTNCTSTSSAPGLQVADKNALQPDRAFDRQWAHTVLERAITNLENEFKTNGNHHHFVVLQPWLAGAGEQSQTHAATELGMSESTIRVSIHRLRKRYKECVRRELAQTLAPGISVDEEMLHLMAAL